MQRDRSSSGSSLKCSCRRTSAISYNNQAAIVDTTDEICCENSQCNISKKRKILFSNITSNMLSENSNIIVNTSTTDTKSQIEESESENLVFFTCPSSSSTTNNGRKSSNDLNFKNIKHVL